jgi:hypothetical protein
MCEPSLEPPIEYDQCKGCGDNLPYNRPDLEYCKWCDPGVPDRSEE